MRNEAGELFNYAICDGCKSAYATTFPANIAQYYETYYSFEDSKPSRVAIKNVVLPFAVSFIDRVNRQHLLQPIMRTFLRRLPHKALCLLTSNLQTFFYAAPTPHMRIAEVGAGSGQFVEQLRSLGYEDTIGVDLFYEEKSPKNYMSRGSVHELTGRYDLLLFNHCFEHAEDPENVMSSCSKLLPENGKLVIQIPNIQSVEFATYGGDWWGFHAPYHFSIPSEVGLQRMAQRNGLILTDRVGTSRYDHYLYSEDYKKGIHDTSPRSIRGAISNRTVEKNMLAAAKRKAVELNKGAHADWIAYYLAKPV